MAFLDHKFNRILVGAIIAVLAVVWAVFLAIKPEPAKPLGITGNEISIIKSSNSLVDQVRAYRQLIERVGPVQAQEDLLASGMPFDGQTHLINHEVGNYLYQTMGDKGLSYCREYFLASCYHGFILNAIGVGGVAEVERVVVNCRDQGPGVYQQCAHGVGHGLLTFAGYANLPKGAEMCTQMTGRIPDFPQFNCEDGVFMENIWAVHDGTPSPDRWVDEKDPMFPCSDSRIKDEYRLACWSNQPSWLYQVYNGDVGKVGQQCLKVTPQNLKDMCFNGLARQIHPVTQGSTDKVFELCGKMPEGWSDFCSNTISHAAFSVGDRRMPFEICNRLTGPGQDTCYQQLIGSVNYYSQGQQNLKQEWCGKIEEEEWRTACSVQQ